MNKPNILNQDQGGQDQQGGDVGGDPVMDKINALEQDIADLKQAYSGEEQQEEPGDESEQPQGYGKDFMAKQLGIGGK